MPEREKFTEDELMQIFAGMAPGTPVAAPVPAAPQPVAPPPPPLAPPPLPVPPPPPPVMPTAPAPADPVLGRPPAIATASVAPLPAEAAPSEPLAAPATAPAAPTGPATVSAADRAAVEDLGHQFEIGRTRMEQVLTPFIGEKVTKKMFTWSLERAQKNHPILKNVHWSASGELMDNGTIEVDRMSKNLDALAGQNVLALAKAALLELLTSRLAAIEQGLGASMRQAVEKEVAKLGAFLK